jgi:crotonobetainyl-CoA:carnitine CoA-transferase CaiB-like acyl-CoA transferase
MKPGLRFSKSPVSIRRDPPPIGRHTDEVMAEVAALKAAE